MAWSWFGFLTGDDVEVLAEAFRVATGFAYRAWDIRTLFVPDVLVAPPIAAASALGIRSVRMLAVVAVLPFVLVTAATTLVLFRLVVRWSGDRAAAFVAAALFSLHWIPLGFGGTVYPRTLATFAVVAAVALVDRWDSPFAALAAGVLAGIAFADRFSEAVFLAPLLVFVGIRCRWRGARLVALLAGFALAVVLLVGAWDRWTWGEWFGSVRKFADLTLIRPDFASRLKRQGPLWYLSNVLRWLAPTLLPLFWFARRQRHAVAAALFVLIPLAALSFVAHKELRYLQGLVPWLAILAALGFAALSRAGRRGAAAALVVVSVAWNLYGLRTFARKTMPSVEAAWTLGADRAIHTVAMSQLWACGDRLYFGDRMQVIDVGTPPLRLADAFPFADAICLYETDLTPEIDSSLAQHGFIRQRTFRRPPARAVVVFRRVSR